MLRFSSGDLLTAQAEALVNAVNCVGVMGKGIALEFKRAYPEMFLEYQRAASAGQIVPGRMHVFRTHTPTLPWFIINFPTKRHWRSKSQMKDIESGLKALIEVIRNESIRSVAVPPLGCGHGGLDWNEVRECIKQAFGELPEDVEVQLFEP